MKAAEQPKFPSRADVEARLRGQHTPAPLGSRETYRTELEARGDVYGALLDRLADRALAAAEKRGDVSGIEALVPITLRLAKADASIAMVGGALASSASKDTIATFTDGLASVINGRLAAMGRTTTANVEADLAGRHPVTSVSIGLEPKKPSG
jgi:hypothetical protein